MKDIDFGRSGFSQYENDLEHFLVIERLSHIIFCLFVALLLVVCLAFPVNAAEVNADDGIAAETWSGVYLVDGISDSTDPTGGESDTGASTSGDGSGNNSGSTEPSEEPLETLPEPSETPVVDVSQGSINAIVDGVAGVQTNTEPSGPLTVDVSEESVNAIADAVSDTTSGVVVTNKDGVSYAVPQEVIDAGYDNYEYFAHVGSPSSYSYWLLSNSQLTVDSDGHWRGSGIRLTYYLGDYRNTTNSISQYGFQTKSVLYSKGNILSYSDSSIYYISDVAESYKISFVTLFDDLIIDSMSSYEFIAPKPSHEGYEFGGWYFDQEYTLPLTDGYVFTSDTTLYAKWIPYRSISFVTNIEGFELSSVKVLSGSSYYVPSFTYEGYEFIGAFTDEEFTTPFVDGSEIIGDSTLYLKFSEIQYNIGGLVTQLLGVAKGLDVIESQLWIILVVGMMYFVYKFFRIFF